METLNLINNYGLNIIVDGILIILLLSLHLALALDDFWNKKKIYSYFRFFIYIVITFMILDILISFGMHYLWNESKLNVLLTLYYLFGESLAVAVVLVIYAFIEERHEIDKKRKKAILLIMTTANIIGTVIIAIQNYKYITLEYINNITETCLIINTVINLILFGYVVIRNRNHLKKNEFIGIIAGAIIISIISMVDVISGIFINIALSAFIIFIYMQILNGRKTNYMKEHDELMIKNAELAEAYNSIMISQIQPHFIYNTLNSIASLCKLDPDMAQKVTIDFARYLRVNMDSLNNREPVDFVKELEHVNTYLEIEKIRFGDHINVETDIQTKSFKIPSLALQPVVENAVKHGICKKDEPGTLKISTREKVDGYIITVEDDGVGFDKNAPLDESRKHIGIENVRNRLKSQSNGNLKIESEPGIGTKATIFIPKKPEEQELN